MYETICTKLNLVFSQWSLKRSKIEKTVSGIPSDGLFFNLIDLIFSIRLITFLIMRENLCNVFVSPYSVLPLPDLNRGNSHRGYKFFEDRFGPSRRAYGL